MPTKTVRMLACFGMLLMVFLLAADVEARGRGGGGRGGGGRGGGGFSRGGGGFDRGGGGLNREAASGARRNPNISRRGPATGGTFGREGSFGSGSRDRNSRPGLEKQPGVGRRPGTGDRPNLGKQPGTQDQPRRDNRPETQDQPRRDNRPGTNDQPGRGDRSDADDRPSDADRRDQAKQGLENRQDNRNEYYDDRNEFYDDWGYYGVGTSITVVTFNSLSCTTTSARVGGVTYYDCGGTWYNRTYSGGAVNYVVVDAPPGH